MSTFDNIDFLLKSQNKKRTELCNYLGVSNNRYTDWKSGRLNSYVKYLPQIAEFLGVTVEFLTSDFDVYDEIEEHTRYLENILKQKNGDLKLKIVYMQLGLIEYDADIMVAMTKNNIECRNDRNNGMSLEGLRKKYPIVDINPFEIEEEYRIQKELNVINPEIRLQRIEELKKELRAKKD